MEAFSILFGVGGITTLISLVFWHIFKFINRLEVRLSNTEANHVDCVNENAKMSREILELRSLLSDNSSFVAAIIIADEHGKIIEWNPGATKLLHWTSAEAIGKDVNIIVPPSYRQAHHEAFTKKKILPTFVMSP